MSGQSTTRGYFQFYFPVQLLCLVYRLFYALTLTESSGKDYSDIEIDY